MSSQIISTNGENASSSVVLSFSRRIKHLFYALNRRTICAVFVTEIPRPILRNIGNFKWATFKISVDSSYKSL